MNYVIHSPTHGFLTKGPDGYWVTTPDLNKAWFLSEDTADSYCKTCNAGFSVNVNTRDFAVRQAVMVLIDE